MKDAEINANVGREKSEQVALKCTADCLCSQIQNQINALAARVDAFLLKTIQEKKLLKNVF